MAYKRLKEDEKNEKIIRELLKLPGNRHCINCNSLGPRYVCTNFWTFVCTTCSGVHREFTHRVKSVSVAKFTSQEVGALQEGGNERAKEFYLKGWNSKKLPESSNIERLRNFIKHVYVESRYCGEKSHKPSSTKVDCQKNIGHYYTRSQSQIELIGPKFELSLKGAASSIIIGSRSKNSTANTTREISFNDNNWANFDCSSLVSRPRSNAKTVGSEVSIMNGYSNNQDSFTAMSSSTPKPVPGDYATQANGLQYPSTVQVVPTIYERPKSTNPFDVSYESTPVQSQTFSSMAYSQLPSPPYKVVQTQQCCTWRMPITTQTCPEIPGNMFHLGDEVGGFNYAFGSLYTSQEPSGISFSSMGNNPFGEF